MAGKPAGGKLVWVSVLCYPHNQSRMNNLQEAHNSRPPFRSQFRSGLNHTLQDCLGRLWTVGRRRTTHTETPSGALRGRRWPVRRVLAVLVERGTFAAAPRLAKPARSWPSSSALRRWLGATRPSPVGPALESEREALHEHARCYGSRGWRQSGRDPAKNTWRFSDPACAPPSHLLRRVDPLD